MRELDSILEAWRAERQVLLQSAAVLATVVRVEGSTYRRPGARMLIRSNGPSIGSISGGCLESDLRRKAAWWTATQPAALRVYDTTSDDDAVWEFGLGCNGVIHVLLERLDNPSLAPTLDFLAECQRRRKPGLVVTSINGPSLGQRWCFHSDGHHTLASTTPLPAALELAVSTALSRARSQILHHGAETYFLEYVAPAQRLFVFGAGHDARPVVDFAAQLGWSVHVLDGRPAYACPVNFPAAASVELLPPSASLASWDIGPADAVVLMTHNFPQDTRLFPQLLERSPRYLGLLGPHNRAAKLYAACRLSQPPGFVHAPVGLDIGSDCPSTVALSIVSGIQAALSQRSGAPLRSRPGSIHESFPESGRALATPAPAAESFACEIALV